MKLIKPCQCTGSGAYVHLACLNSWRSTSRKAYTTCSICNYNYKVKKSELSKYLVDEIGALIVTFIIFVVGVLFCGIFVLFILPNFTDYDLSSDLSAHFQIIPWWRACTVLKERTFFSILFSEDISQQLYDAAICNFFISNTIDIIFHGTIILGLCGLIYSLYDDIIRCYRDHNRVAAPAVDYLHTFFIIFYVIRHYQKIYPRIGCPIGCRYTLSKVCMLMALSVHSFVCIVFIYEFTHLSVLFSFMSSLICLYCFHLLVHSFVCFVFIY